MNEDRKGGEQQNQQQQLTDLLTAFLIEEQELKDAISRKITQVYECRERIDWFNELKKEYPEYVELILNSNNLEARKRIQNLEEYDWDTHVSIENQLIKLLQGKTLETIRKEANSAEKEITRLTKRIGVIRSEIELLFILTGLG